MEYGRLCVIRLDCDLSQGQLLSLNWLWLWIYQHRVLWKISSMLEACSIFNLHSRFWSYGEFQVQRLHCDYSHAWVVNVSRLWMWKCCLWALWRSCSLLQGCRMPSLQSRFWRCGEPLVQMLNLFLSWSGHIMMEGKLYYNLLRWLWRLSWCLLKGWRWFYLLRGCEVNSFWV